MGRACLRPGEASRPVKREIHRSRPPNLAIPPAYGAGRIHARCPTTAAAMSVRPTGSHGSRSRPITTFQNTHALEKSHTRSPGWRTCIFSVGTPCDCLGGMTRRWSPCGRRLPCPRSASRGSPGRPSVSPGTPSARSRSRSVGLMRPAMPIGMPWPSGRPCSPSTGLRPWMLPGRLLGGGHRKRQRFRPPVPPIGDPAPGPCLSPSQAAGMAERRTLAAAQVRNSLIASWWASQCAQ